MASHMQSSLLVGFSAVCMSLFLFISSTQITPYMDEIFHVPQAQKYCDFKFSEWDSMITTLPGLYLVSVAILRPFSWLLNLKSNVICSILWLRMINLLFSVGNVLLIYMILKNLNRESENTSKETHQSVEDKRKEGWYLKQMMTALVLGTFPVLYFFTFLYYTDTGATFFVLFMYMASIYNHHYVAMVTGFWAIMFRQTNIIWVIFTAGITTANHLQPILSQQLGNKSINVLSVITFFVIEIFKQFKSIFHLLFPYIVLVLGFVGFVFVNGSIVVGDKSHHQVCLHFPQLFYFSSFSVFFLSPHFLTTSYFTELFHSIRSLTKPLRMLVFLCIIAVICILIGRFTYVHPYLLADNRHYPFYVWNKIFQKHWSVKYLLVPVYIIALWSIKSLLKKNAILWQIIFFVCTLLVLTPQMLLEFRYFIVPFLLARVHIPSTSYIKLGMEFCLYSVVNAFTLWMFVKKPFYWSDSNDLQRFMW